MGGVTGGRCELSEGWHSGALQRLTVCSCTDSGNAGCFPCVYTGTCWMIQFHLTSKDSHIRAMGNAQVSFTWFMPVVE